MANKKYNAALCASRGFTFIEVMIVAVIVGILATIAYPSYRYISTKAKRAEGRAALMQLMQQQERYYSQNTTYVAFSSTSADPEETKFKWYSADTPLASAYELSAGACANETIRTCVKLVAKPGTSKVSNFYSDAECGTLTFTSTGVKSADAPNCW